MSEQVPTPKDPELIPSQQAVKELADSILSFKPEKAQITFWGFRSSVSPDDLQTKLRDTHFGDLLLADGDTLSIATDRYYPDLDLFVGKAEMTGVGIRAYGWEENKWRIYSGGPQEPPYDVIRYPGEKDWSRELEIRLSYSNGKERASQIIAVSTSSRGAGQTPLIVRLVSAPAYAETGYEGHSRVYKRDSDEAVTEFIELASEVFTQRIED